MFNVLKVNKQETIHNLYKRGWSLRRIAGELGMNRRTVKRYAAKCTRQPTTGSVTVEAAKDPKGTQRPADLQQRPDEFKDDPHPLRLGRRLPECVGKWRWTNSS
jgi:IS30 family transposase